MPTRCWSVRAPGSADVRETAASPTLERGSNSLIPGGLSTDAFGGPRVLGPMRCVASPVAIVDMGAAEYAYPPLSCPPLIVSSHPQQPLAPTLLGPGPVGEDLARGQSAREAQRERHPGQEEAPDRHDVLVQAGPSGAGDAHVHRGGTAGRKVGKRCVAHTHKNRHKRRCTRTVVAGTLSFAAHAGINKVRFQGLVSKRRKLKLGSYKLFVTAHGGGQALAPGHAELHDRPLAQRGGTPPERL